MTYHRIVRRTLAGLFAIACLATVAFGIDSLTIKGPEYVGSERCIACHQIQYKGWVKTFHSTAIKDAKKDPSVILGDLKAPDLPFKQEDIYYTIGGHMDQRYLTRIDNDYFILPKIWSVQSKKWRSYTTYGWQRRPYSKFCIGCHSIGFNPANKTIYEHAIGCESCHGSGVVHVGAPSQNNIVNPGRLPKNVREEVCASCHVRGKDLSDEYSFPIGYKPGGDLGQYLIPLDKEPGESNTTAIHRLWDKWKASRESQARVKCEVCEIHQEGKPKEKKASADAYCLDCHEFTKERIVEHTHHGLDSINCSDCHVSKPPSTVNETKPTDVHSYGFFLIHSQNCWDKEINKRCAKCHADKGEKWAYDTFESWKKPVVIDH
jgi:hypothetical protein